MMQNAGVLYILTCKCAWRHSGVPFCDNFSTSAPQKVARECQFFTILTWKCASRYSGVQFFNISTSKSGPNLTCFVHFDLKMSFSLQRRAIFQHLNFKKWSEPDMFCTFWLENVRLATAACNLSTSQLQKVVRPWHVLYILTSKCASRYSGVQFFLCPLQSYLRTRRFSEVTFRPSRHTKHWKTQHFATSLTFRACWSSFFPHLLIFFLAALLFQLSILSEVRLLNFLRQIYTPANDSSKFIQPYHQQKRNTLAAAVTHNNSESTFLVLSRFIKFRTAVDAGIPSNLGQGKVGKCEVVHDSKPQISTVSSGFIGTCHTFRTEPSGMRKQACIMIYPKPDDKWHVTAGSVTRLTRHFYL